MVSYEVSIGIIIINVILWTGSLNLKEIGLAQQNLSPAPVSIIFSLEGVFGSIAAWILLDQFLNEFKFFGIIKILSAVIFSQLAPMYDKRKYGRN